MERLQFVQLYFRSMVWYYLKCRTPDSFTAVCLAWRIKRELAKPKLRLVA